MIAPEPGDVLRVTRAASVQFVEPILFRVIRLPGWPTYHGWIWLEGYEVNSVGDAIQRRRIFVQLAGLRYLRRPESAERRPGAGRPRINQGRYEDPRRGTGANQRR